MSKTKKSVSETGHAKNVANFQRLIDYVTDYGAIYNPSKRNLRLTALQSLKTDADAALADVISKNTLYNNAVNSRFAEFSDIKTLSTRLVNALQSTDAAPETVHDANGFNKKIQGKRANKAETQTDPDAPAPQTISTSQQSYDQMLQHFTGLKSVLENEAFYAPNEVELQVATLETKISNMTTKNADVSQAHTKIKNARIARDKIIYEGDNTILDTANEVKNYVKSIFGAGSPEVKQLIALRFRK